MFHTIASDVRDPYALEVTVPENVTRYSITMPSSLMEAFDEVVRRRHYANRSEALRDLVRKTLVEEQWARDDAAVMGTVTVVYDHHQRELSRRLTALQHHAHDMVVCTTHVHLDHHHCLEVIVLRGRTGRVREIADAIIGTRGVIHGELVCTAVTSPSGDRDEAASA
jgi:CopG family transcriptional regulator, nickel-responsive regulator